MSNFGKNHKGSKKKKKRKKNSKMEKKTDTKKLYKKNKKIKKIVNWKRKLIRRSYTKKNKKIKKQGSIMWRWENFVNGKSLTKEKAHKKDKYNIVKLLK